MDLDLEIIKEEGDCPDPLFDSIMNAMNSMKEATADKIYQKIQREGETNYSKPQVDRALASALKYGIFEVRNNRYRVRDDILDDEDTVYWKIQRKKERTPFRIQDDINERQVGPKLDPERDNQRFRRLVNKDSQECPHCGRTKRPVMNEGKFKGDRKSGYRKNSKKKRKRTKRDTNTKGKEAKRRQRTHSDGEEKCIKKRKINPTKPSEPQDTDDQNSNAEDRFLDDMRDDVSLTQEKGASESSSVAHLLPTSEHSFDSYLSVENKNKLQNKKKSTRSLYSFECTKADRDIFKVKGSSISIKSESDSEKTNTSSVSDDRSQSRIVDSFFESLPCTSRKPSNKTRAQYLNSSDIYDNQYGSRQTDQSKGKSDWLECSGEPESTIIQSNNVLTIEPMDSLAFKNPEQASYIS